MKPHKDLTIGLSAYFHSLTNEKEKEHSCLCPRLFQFVTCVIFSLEKCVRMLMKLFPSGGGDMRHSAIRTNYNITTISALIQPEHLYVCTESIAFHTVRLQASLRLNVMSLGSIRSLVSIVYCPIAFSHLLTSFILMCLCIRGTEKRLSFIPIV